MKYLPNLNSTIPSKNPPTLALLRIIAVDLVCPIPSHSSILPALFLIICCIHTEALEAQDQCGDHAGTNSCTSSTDPGSSVGALAPQALAGNPVDMATGNKFMRELDFSDSSGDFILARYYNSLNADFNLGLGAGWHATYTPQLLKINSQQIDIIQSNGRRIIFRSRLPESSHFFANNSRDGFVVSNQSTRVWTLPGNRTVIFRGPLPVEYQWLNSSRNAKKSLTFIYKNDRLDSLQLRKYRAKDKRFSSSTKTEVIRFYYQNSDQQSDTLSTDTHTKQAKTHNISKIILPTNDTISYRYHQNLLIEVLFNGKLNRIYHYNADTGSALLSGISDGNNQRLSSYFYNSAGKVVKSINNDTHRTITLDYLDIDNAKPSPENRSSVIQTISQTEIQGVTQRTLVRGNSGEHGLFEFIEDSSNKTIQLVSSSIALCADCKPRTLTYQYDKEGNIKTINTIKNTADLSTSTMLQSLMLITAIPGITTLAKSTPRSDDLTDSTAAPTHSVFGTVQTLQDRYNRIDLASENLDNVSDPRNLRVATSLLSDFRLSVNPQPMRSQDSEPLETECDIDSLPIPEAEPLIDDQSQQCLDSTADPTNTQLTSIPGASFRDAWAAECVSYFDAFMGTVRGFEIEAGFASHPDFSQALPTIRNFPVVDFVLDRTAVAVVSMDLRSRSYLETGNRLYREIVNKAADMVAGFLDPLAQNGYLTASQSGLATTIDKADVDELVFELVIQQGAATPAQQAAILKAQREINQRFDLTLRLVEIP